MKRFALFITALAVGLTMAVGNAEAARVGGGKSFGMQRQMAPVNKPAATAAPAPSSATAAKAPGAATPAAQPKRSWMGPLAGLAAGLGLAALASHFGFGEELANMLMFALLAFAVMAVVGYFLRKRAAGQQATMAGAGAPYNAPSSMYQANDLSGSSVASASNIPANFDADGFIRNAKVGFIRLQAAHDAGDLADIREFTSPEMFAEIRMDLDQRHGAPQKTDIVSLNAEILDVSEEAQRYVVSVRFNGMLREEAEAAPVAIDEIWHLTKPVTGQGGWVLAGIQQVQ